MSGHAPDDPIVARLNGLVVVDVIRVPDEGLGLVLRDPDTGSRVYLRSGAAGWRWLHAGRIADGSYAAPGRAEGITAVAGRRITGVELSGSPPLTHVRFDGETTLTLFSAAATHPAWFCFAPDREVVVVAADGSPTTRHLAEDDPLLALAREGLAAGTE